MSKAMKIMLSIGAAVLIVGLALGTAGFFLGGMNSVTVSRDGIHVVGSHEAQELIKVDETYAAFDAISINVDLLDEVIIKSGDTYAVRGQNYEDRGGLNAVVNNGILEITTPLVNGFGFGRNWTWNINFGFDVNRAERCYIEITIPEDAVLESLYVDVDVSDVSFIDVKCDDLTADVDLGNLSLRNIVAEKALLIDNCGDMTLTGFNSGTLELKSDLGNVKIDGVLKGRNVIDSSSGNVTLMGIQVENLDLDVDLGDIKIDGILEGDCTIDSSSGNVALTLNQRESDLSYEVDLSLGEVRINGRTVGGSMHNTIVGAKNTLRIDSDLGNVSLDFLK
ncbi:MAG: DUF4097 domain-containing protein [Clostridiales Family XIII bacterium]|jgi:hypothetical protein|nr:DUF4097 domain-containing protein [Clostridiales Family XIII bacterium]